MTEIDEFVLRHNDFRPDDVQESLRDSFRAFFDKHCPTSRVRDAETLGWDSDLWKQLGGMRPVAMGLPEEVGGDGAGLSELVFVIEELGRYAAPVPLVDTIIAARLLARIDSDEARHALADIREGAVAATAAATTEEGGRRLVSSGSCATYVIGLRGSELVLSRASGPHEMVANLAGAPLGWWDSSDDSVIASGSAARRAMVRSQLELRVLTAASMVGMGERALEGAVQHAKDRIAFGVPIGSFQAIAHPIADVATAIQGAQRMTRKAAWFGDFEPERFARLAIMAFVYSSDAALQAGQVAIHTHGGFGFTLESDAQLYYRRAKGWALIVGDRSGELQSLADELYPTNRLARNDA